MQSLVSSVSRTEQSTVFFIKLSSWIVVYFIQSKKYGIFSNNLVILHQSAVECHPYIDRKLGPH